MENMPTQINQEEANKLLSKTKTAKKRTPKKRRSPKLPTPKDKAFTPDFKAKGPFNAYGLCQLEQNDRYAVVKSRIENGTIVSQELLGDTEVEKEFADDQLLKHLSWEEGVR